MTTQLFVLAAILLVLAPTSRATADEAERYDADGVRGISRFAELYAKAATAQRERRPDEALGLLQKASVLQPKNALGHLGQAEVHFAAGRLGECQQALNVADALTGSRDQRMRTRVLVLRAMVAEKLPEGDALAAWLGADTWVSEVNATGPERASVRQHVEAHEKMRGQKVRDEAVRARILEGEAKPVAP